MKRNLITAFVLALLVSLFAVNVAAKENTDDDLLIPESKIVSADGIKVSLNGGLLEFDVLPTTINDRTMVPLHAIFEALSATVEWNEQTQTVTSEKGDTTVVLTIGSDKMTVNGETVTLDSPATVVDEQTLVPVRAISEVFDINVDWDEEDSLVLLREDKYVDIETTLLYDLSNRTVEVSNSDLETYLTQGWYEYPVITMYAADGRTQVVAKSEVETQKALCWYDYPVATIYAEDGSTQVIAKSDVEAKKAEGWYDYPVTMLYAVDGRTLLSANSDLASNKAAGWYEYPVALMYAADGRTQIVATSEFESNKAVGWYDYPVTTMYAADGRTVVIYQSEEQIYRNNGWYTASQYNIMQYAYLAGSDFRSIRLTYPHAVAQGAALYPYTDSNGDSCILIYISYKITGNWDAYYLHNLSNGKVIKNPSDYYSNRSKDYYGSDKLTYMNLSIEALDAQINARKVFRGELDGGWVVDAATLNL